MKSSFNNNGQENANKSLSFMKKSKKKFKAGKPDKKLNLSFHSQISVNSNNTSINRNKHKKDLDQNSEKIVSYDSSALNQSSNEEVAARKNKEGKKKRKKHCTSSSASPDLSEKLLNTISDGSEKISQQIHKKKKKLTNNHTDNVIEQESSTNKGTQPLGTKKTPNPIDNKSKLETSTSQGGSPFEKKKKKNKQIFNQIDNVSEQKVIAQGSDPSGKKMKKKKGKNLNHIDNVVGQEISTPNDNQPLGKKEKNVMKGLKKKHRNKVENTLYSNEEANYFKPLNSLGEDTVRSKQTNESDDESLQSFDAESYPSDTDDEVGKPVVRRNFADASSEESSSESSDNESQHTFDADSYPSDSEDEAEKKKGLPVNLVPSEELEERERRTIFVGNLPHSVERKELKKWFFKFGKVECVRLRSAPIADPNLPRKVAVIKKTFHESRSNIHAYIRFKTVEAAKNALSANGALFKDHIIRVDSSKHEGKYDASKGVFVGNVPFGLEENTLRDFFSGCGDIESVRIVRDKNTGVGKGFAYVNFHCSTAVPLALKLDGETLEKRELRVKPVKYQKKNVKPFLKVAPPKYHSKKFFNSKFKNSEKSKKVNKFQGEISYKKVKKSSKKKSAEERKRQKFSEILNNNKQKKTA